MRAIRQYEFGPAEVLRHEEVPDPHPGRGQVRIAVAAAGVHVVDTFIRQSGVGPYGPPELPMTPGREVAGIVDEIGEDVASDWLGRHVVAHLGQASGGYAEFAVREVEAVQVLPEGTDPAAAVAMIGTGRTTAAILRIARPTSDDVVLVTSAAGGIGALAVQHARNIGATVVGAAGGPLKVGKVGELGADLAVDYTEEGWADRVRDELGRPVSLVLDGAGGAYGRAAFDLIGAGGRIVMYGREFGEHRFTSDDLINRSVTASVSLGPNLLKDVPGGMRELEDEALAALADGSLNPLVGPPFPLAEAAAAHVALENRQTYGKVVLVPSRH